MRSFYGRIWPAMPKPPMRFYCLNPIPDLKPARTHYSLNCFMVSHMNAGRSAGSREVTRLPSTTTSLSS